MSWKRDSEEAAIAVGAWDMTGVAGMEVLIRYVIGGDNLFTGEGAEQAVYTAS